MRRALPVVLLCLAGCKARVPHATTQEVATFLDGGVVMMDHVAGKLSDDETVWPVEENEDLFSWLEQYYPRFGLKTRDQIRAAFSVDPVHTPRAYAGLLWGLHDLPSRERYWKSELGKDPNDLRAAVELARLENAIDQPQAGLDALANVPDVNPRWHDVWNGSPGELEYLRCSMLLQVGREDEAKHACGLAIALGDQWGHVELALIAADQHDAKEAVAQLEAASEISGVEAWPAFQLASGIALWASGEHAAARALWAKVLIDGTINAGLFETAQRTPELGAVGWERELWKWNHAHEAELLSDCGHYYLDLGIPDRAEKCFALSEKLLPGPAEAQRLVHEGETNPHAALARALEEVKTDRNPLMLSAVGWLYERTGDPWSARKFAAEALKENPRDVKATSLMWVACGDDKIKDLPCVIEYRKRLGLPTHLPGVKLPGEK